MKKVGMLSANFPTLNHCGKTEHALKKEDERNVSKQFCCWGLFSMTKILQNEGRDERDLEASRGEEEEETEVALFSVIGMTCSACTGSVEKAIKKLPGIHEAAVDVLNNRAQVIFSPRFVSVSTLIDFNHYQPFALSLVLFDGGLVFTLPVFLFQI